MQLSYSGALMVLLGVAFIVWRNDRLEKRFRGSLMLTDQKGQQLHVGDRVLIPAVVTRLYPERTLLNVDVQLEIPALRAEGYRPLIGLNAGQVRVERRGRPRKKAVKVEVARGL